MSPFVLSWGVIGTGWIASKFVTNLAIQHDGFRDVQHSVAAVGSRSLARSQQFIQENIPNGCVAQQKGLVSTLPVACGSYEEVCNHKDVDAIYIATLHPSHYADATLALKAGKHCLIEKPAVLNAAEWRALRTLAAERGVFLMEGMWTRFLPAVVSLEKILFEQCLIGDVRQVNATFAMCHDATPDEHRLLAPSAAGGALLDLGAYSILPSLVALYNNPKNRRTQPQSINGTLIWGRTGVDVVSTIVMTFPGMQAIGIGTASLASNSPREEKCVISGTKGEIIIHDGLSRITKFTVRTYASDNPLPFLPTKWNPDQVVEEPVVGFGLVYEANAVARCIRDGLLQSACWSHDDTSLVMKIFDEVRRQNGYVFKEGLEKVK